ncbi:MAG TPA: retropepsin-like aspartic protease [Ramlibacter sp.]|nr:retropepsin-like aspartic protease [Ramlibacter sp.]
MNKIAALALSMAFAGAACAQSVQLQGMLGNKALLVVDGGTPRIVAPGETVKGVKVLSTSGDLAVVEVDGKRQTLRVGEAPSSIGASGSAPGSGSKIVLTAGSGGHFMTPGRINGQQVQFMVDTGATAIAMGEAEATRLGVKYKEGRVGISSTANGPVTTYVVKLASVRVGDVEVREVDAMVVPAFMPYILLGNSFLGRFQMKRENDLMVLERRY